MQRVTITLDDDLMGDLDRVIAERGYQGRSEALRDLVRAGIKHSTATEDGDQPCVAALVYVYDHEARQLSRRLTQAFHDHHELTLSALHVHLDHASCLEVAVLRGTTNEVRHFADHVIAERFVRYGEVVMVPVKDAASHEAPHPHE